MVLYHESRTSLKSTFSCCGSADGEGAGAVSGFVSGAGFFSGAGLSWAARLCHANPIRPIPIDAPRARNIRRIPPPWSDRGVRSISEVNIHRLEGLSIFFPASARRAKRERSGGRRAEANSQIGEGGRAH